MATFNPAALVKSDSIFVLYRAKEKLGEKEIGGNRSRIGLAYSTYGKSYTKFPEPILCPDNDDQKKDEWPGGVEDTRIVQTKKGFTY